jgi:uncharacterized membrane protein
MSKRSISIIAFVSVLINILLIGGIAGRFYSGLDRPSHGSLLKGKMHSVISHLPEEKAQWYKQTLGEAREARKEKLKAIKILRAEAVEILEAEQFDVESFKQKLQQLDELGVSIKKHQMHILIELAQQLDVTERRTLSIVLLSDNKLKKQAN